MPDVPDVPENPDVLEEAVLVMGFVVVVLMGMMADTQTLRT